jgi:ABC-2 type transport system ATP-binding protein
VVVGAVQPIIVRGLKKQYGNHQAVSGIDLDVHQGEVFALIGPNGAGKTTTVEILEGIRSRTAGDVEVLGFDPARDRRTWRARIGVVPQSTGVYLDLTVREVVEHFAAFYPAPLPVAQVLDMVGLTGQQKKQSVTLSGGQQRRLDVAVGVIGDPELIFLDEPTTGLDPVARREAWDMVRYFAARGRTTVLTTHYLDEAEALAQRAAIIVDGRVVEVGAMHDIGGRAGTPTTISFVRPPGLAGRGLPQLPGDCAVQSHGASVSLLTHTPCAVVRTLLQWAEDGGTTELPELRVHQPTLEEVYLELIRRNRVTASKGDIS